MKLGEVLKRWRVHADMDQRSMAGMIGISASSLCRIEGGTSPDTASLLKILNWLLDENGRSRNDRSKVSER